MLKVQFADKDLNRAIALAKRRGFTGLPTKLAREPGALWVLTYTDNV